MKKYWRVRWTVSAVNGVTILGGDVDSVPWCLATLVSLLTLAYTTREVQKVLDILS